jgi:hypothetical protein
MASLNRDVLGCILEFVGELMQLVALRCVGPLWLLAVKDTFRLHNQRSDELQEKGPWRRLFAPPSRSAGSLIPLKAAWIILRDTIQSYAISTVSIADLQIRLLAHLRPAMLHELHANGGVLSPETFDAMSLMPSLSALHLRRVGGVNWITVEKLPMVVPNLVVLDVSGSRGFNARCFNSLGQLARLETLAASNCSDLAPLFISRAPEQPFFPDLRHLDLSLLPNLTDSCVTILMSAVPKLESIDLSNCAALTDAVFRAFDLDDVHRKVMLRLDGCKGIDGCGIGDAPNVEELWLGSCFRVSTDSFARGMAPRGTRDKDRRLLRRLVLANCHRLRDAALDAILTSGIALQSLDISACPFISTAAKDRLFEGLTSLKRLDDDCTLST